MMYSEKGVLFKVQFLVKVYFNLENLDENIAHATITLPLFSQKNGHRGLLNERIFWQTNVFEKVVFLHNNQIKKDLEFSPHFFNFSS